MKKGLKIVTIGGGSSYTPELVEGFINRYEELPVKELWLVDIEAGKEKLEIVGNLAKRMVKKAGVDMKINLTLDRREALRDADFVTTQLRVGLLDARIKDVEELCPNAWMVNFTNPTGIITEAVFKYTNFRRYIGLCNVPIHLKNDVAKLFNVESDRISMDFAGLNHMVYGLNVSLDGEDVTKEAIDKFVKADISMQNIKAIDFNAEFVKSLGAIPCPYHRYYYKTKEMLEDELREFKEGKARGQVVKELEEQLFELYKDEKLDVKPPQLEKRGGAYYSDAACNLISSIYNDKKDIQVVNTLNKGSIRDFKDEQAVEVSSVITKNGPKPISIGYLPDSVHGLVSQIKSFEVLAAKAAVYGDYESALLALCINPLIPSDDLAKTILDEMLEAHKDYLPRFNR